MKIMLYGLMTLVSLTSSAQNYYANIIDYFTYQSRIEIYDTTQQKPRITIPASPNNAADDGRVTKDGYFAYRRGEDGVSDEYCFLDGSFNLAGTFARPKPEIGYENIDGHCIYKDDSLIIYILERFIELPEPVFLTDMGNSSHVIDNLIVVEKNGVTVLEFSNWTHFTPKYILGEPVNNELFWDVAHVNSVEWDGTGIIVSSLCYGIYKIDIAGNIVWEQDSLVFKGPKPVRQHDLRYLGNGVYSFFSNGNESNKMFAATFSIVNDTVVYDYLHVPNIGFSHSMGNFEHKGVLNYGAHDGKFVFADTSIHHHLKPNEYAYRVGLHNFAINAKIVQMGDSLVYTPQNEYSNYTWSNGAIGNTIAYTPNFISVTEITPLGFIVYTEWGEGGTVGVNELKKPSAWLNSQPYNLNGQPVEPKGLYIKQGKVYCSPN